MSTRIGTAEVASPSLGTLIERAARSSQQQACHIVDRCLEILPHYQKLSPDILRIVDENVLYHISLFYRLLLDERAIAPDELEPARRVARDRARQGVPLGELFTFYQTGFAIVWEELMAAGAPYPDLRARLLERMAALISSHTQVTTATAHAYVEERERLSRFNEQELDDFARLVLTADAPSAVLANRARALGLPVDEPLIALVLRLPAHPDSHEALLRSVNVRRALTDWLKPLRGIVGHCHEGFVTVLAEAALPEDLERSTAALLGAGGRVGVGERAETVAELCRSAHEALRAVRIGTIVAPEGMLFRYKDFAIFELLRVGSGDAEAFARHVLRSLAGADGNPAILETLRALCRHEFRIKLTAAALSVHPNTLAYRMRQIRDRFGIELDGANARLRLHLALLIRDGQRALSPTRS
jgi:sugar diacid utilization regulator